HTFAAPILDFHTIGAEKRPKAFFQNDSEFSGNPLIEKTSPPLCCEPEGPFRENFIFCLAHILEIV
ncbi:MAG: hypothetical protein ACOC54_05070, partial [Candidatus Sumerlaeota bacterium]